MIYTEKFQRNIKWILHHVRDRVNKIDLYAKYHKISSLFEPAHEIMVLFVLRKLILQTRMRSHPVG